VLVLVAELPPPPPPQASSAQADMHPTATIRKRCFPLMGQTPVNTERK
jgi:hypothetical protein